MGGESLDLQPVLIEDQRAIDIAQRAGQINIGDGAMIDLHLALGKGLGKRACHRQINRDHAGGSEVGIEALDQLQVDPALCPQIKFAFAGQMHLAGGRNVSVLAHQMELVNLQRLIGNGKTDRALVLDLDVFDIGVQIVQIGGELQFARPAQRTHHVDFAVRPRMSVTPLRACSPEDRVQLELVEAEVHIGGPVVAQHEHCHRP